MGSLLARWGDPLWPLRVVRWAALLVIPFRGIAAIIFRHFGDGGQWRHGICEPGRQAVSLTLAEAYAAEFGRVYLSFSPQNQGQREQALAAFVPASVLGPIRTSAGTAPVSSTCRRCRSQASPCRIRAVPS